MYHLAQRYPTIEVAKELSAQKQLGKAFDLKRIDVDTLKTLAAKSPKVGVSTLVKGLLENFNFIFEDKNGDFSPEFIEENGGIAMKNPISDNKEFKEALANSPTINFLKALVAKLPGVDDKKVDTRALNCIEALRVGQYGIAKEIIGDLLNLKT